MTFRRVYVLRIMESFFMLRATGSGQEEARALVGAVKDEGMQSAVMGDSARPRDPDGLSRILGQLRTRDRSFHRGAAGEQN